MVTIDLTHLTFYAWRMAEAFKDSRRSLARGRELIAELNARFVTFVNTKPYASIVEPDPNRTHNIYKIKLLNVSALDGFTSIAADAGQNLRDVLDKAFYVIAITVGHDKPWQVTFPFATRSDTGLGDDIENQIKGRLKGIPAELHTLVRGFKPYKGGNIPLWALNEIANAKKHRVTVEAGIAGKPTISNMEIIGTGNVGPQTIAQIGPHKWDSAKQEMVIARIPKDAHVDYGNMKFRFFIAFDKLEFLGGQPAAAVLNIMADEVDRILMAIEAECGRIGIL